MYGADVSGQADFVQEEDPKDKVEGVEEAMFASQKCQLSGAKSFRKLHLDRRSAVTLEEVALADAI